MNILDIAIAKKLAGGGGGSGTDNYNDLSNLPKINDTTLSGNKSSSALGLQSEINSDSKLASDLVDDTNQDNKFVTSTEKNTWNAKQNAIDSDHKLSSDLVDDANHTNKFVTSTEKSTWNGKQNAIDSEHKLSSSLVSFTTAEAAALASGIDSAKVAQISTNQSNILSVASQNPISVYSLDSKSMTGAGYLVAENTPVKMPKGNYNIAYTSDKAISIVLVVNNGNTEIHRESMTCAIGANSFNFTTTTNGDNIRVYVSESCEIDNLCIVPKVYRDCGYTDYVYALPNYDLTRLEAEDRAGLVECVDGGAKNKVNIVSPTATIGNITFTHNSDGSITVNGTANNTDTFYYLTSTTGNSPQSTLMNVGSSPCVLTGCPSGGTANTYELQLATNSGDYRDRGTGIDIPANSSGSVVIAIRAGYAPSNLKFYPMICTKAAFGVSNKFVPYRPNWDLVSASVPQTSYVVNHNVTTSNVYELVNNLYIDVPTGKRVFIAVGAKKSNPIGIALCDNNTYAENRVIIQNEVANAQGMVSATGIYDNGDVSGTTRLYVFMKSQTSMAIKSRITLSWWYI